MKKEVINEVCLDCAKKHDKKHKESFGMWRGTCDMCGKESVWVAAAGHDFGIYNNEEEEERDKIQDKL